MDTVTIQAGQHYDASLQNQASGQTSTTTAVATTRSDEIPTSSRTIPPNAKMKTEMVLVTTNLETIRTLPV